MTTARWLICRLGNLDDIQKLAYAVQENEREAKVVTLGEGNDIIEAPADDKDCVVTCGSIWYNRSLRESHPNWIGNFHNKETFLCSKYYAFWGHRITQEHFAFLPFSEILSRKEMLYEKFGVNNQLFIRPDSGEKEFNGELVVSSRFADWHEETRAKLITTQVVEDIVCVVSSPVNIDKEYRLIIADGKVVTGSVYKIAKHLSSECLSLEQMDDDPDGRRVLDFAQKAIAENPPLPPFYCLDLAISGKRVSILEVGCFCCCGLYECDRKKIATAISRSAEKAFDQSISG